MKVNIGTAWDTVKTTWADDRRKQLANDGWGMCHTDSGRQVVCSLNGVGCDVDHAFVKVRNLERKT